MSGYTPLFGSLTTGTLCGKWPDIGLWPIVLSLSDRHGVVDVTPDYLARITGLPVADVAACMQRFCAPDPYSRTGREGGARLVLLDSHRDWGWKIVNHATYRERARKQAWDAERTASGRDAERKRSARLVSRDVPTCPDSPDISRQSPLSDSDTNTDLRDSRRLAPTCPSRPKGLHAEIVQAYHDTLPDLPRVKSWTRKRESWLKARIAERLAAGKPADSVDYWRKLFESVAASDFLMGRSGQWRASFEWLMAESNFTKVIEGNYRNGASNAR